MSISLGQVRENLIATYSFLAPKVVSVAKWAGRLAWSIIKWAHKTTSAVHTLTLDDKAKSAVLAATYAIVSYVAAHAILLPEPISATVVTAVATLATSLLTKYFNSSQCPVTPPAPTPTP